MKENSDDDDDDDGVITQEKESESPKGQLFVILVFNILHTLTNLNEITDSYSMRERDRA